MTLWGGHNVYQEQGAGGTPDVTPAEEDVFRSRISC